MRAFLRERGQTIVNIVVSIALGGAAAYRVHETWTAKKFDAVEAIFFGSVLVLVMIILVRRQHVAMERSVFRQCVALVAFFSPLAFDTEPDVPYEGMALAAKVVAGVGIVLGVIVLLNLGRSFGIMIAVREVKTTGLYGVVRHPMYVTDTVFRTSFILANPSVYNIALYVAATACYVYRAILEERFLSLTPGYRDYMASVRYRFIPWVF